MNSVSAPSSAADAIIVGGGIYGLMIALEAGKSGRRVIVLERDRIGAATSSNWFRILHGGLRYLQRLDIPRVVESVAERRWYLRFAPDLVTPMRFLMPLYGDGIRRPAAFRAAFLADAALVAAVGTPDNFRPGRHLAAWLGLTPRHVGSGHRMVLGGISKRGDRYLRMLLIHGARSVLIRAQMNAKAGKPLTRLEQWALDLRGRSNHNKATCALANKLARIAWAVWAHDRAFDGNHSVAQAA